MNINSTRFRINTLIQMARITENQKYREELIQEIQLLLDDIESYEQPVFSSGYFGEDSILAIEEYLKDKQRVCAIQIWQEALGEEGRPQKWQTTEINDIVSQMPEWERMKSPYRFSPSIGNQRGFQRRREV